MSVTRLELEAKLEALVESDGDATEIASVIKEINSLPVGAADIGIEPTVVVPDEQQSSTQVERITNVDGITKEALGIGSEFTSSLNALSIDTIKTFLVEVDDTDDLLALIIPGVSKVSANTRIHLELRGEVKRAARGMGLVAAGGVVDGIITSPNGNIHQVEDGVCHGKTTSLQPDSFSQQMAVIERTSPCLGHLDYRNIGNSEKPKWEKTGREFTRCQHQWALMFNAGYFVTVSKKTYREVVLTEIASRVGDDTAREVAKAQIQEWRDNRQTNFENRKAVAQGIQHAKNVMGLTQDQPLPDVPEVLTLTLPDGQSIRDKVLSLGGARFVVSFEVPLNGQPVVQNIRANSLDELTSRVAPIYAAAKLQQATLKPLSVEAAA